MYLLHDGQGSGAVRRAIEEGKIFWNYDADGMTSALL